MKKQILLFSAASMAFLAGCSDSSVTTAYDSDKANAKITLSIVDGNTNEALEGAEVKNQFSKKTSVSDESGFVVFKKNDIGEYIFDITKGEDYSTTRVVVPVKDNEGDKEVTRVPDVAVTVPLYKADVTVTGHVYYRDAKTGNLEPAPKVKVVLSYDNSSASSYDLSGVDLTGMDADDLKALKFLMEGGVTTSIYPSEVTVTTDSAGAYTFKNVAEMVNFRVSALQTKIDSKLYAGSRSVSGSGIRAGSKTLDMLVLVADGETPALLKTNLNKVEQNSSLEFQFTVELNKDSLEGHWIVTKSGSKVLTTVSLGSDKKTVIVKPLSESWSKKTSYEVIGEVYSKDGMRLAVDETFSVGSVDAPKGVSDLKVSLDTSDYLDSYGAVYNFRYNANLELKWKAPSKSEVDAYDIYYMTNEMDDYEFFASSDTTFYNRSIGSISDLNDTNVVSMKFVVLARNAAGTSSAADAKSVTWKVPEIVDEEEDDDEDEDDGEDGDDEDEDDGSDEDDEDLFDDEDEDLFDDEDI